VASRSANFQFSANEAVSFQFALDTGSRYSCSSPTSISGLTNSNHIFRVRAVDTAGNVDDTSARRQWDSGHDQARDTITRSTFKLYKVNSDTSENTPTRGFGERTRKCLTNTKRGQIDSREPIVGCCVRSGGYIGKIRSPRNDS
jgi:hypothetical protein